MAEGQVPYPHKIENVWPVFAAEFVLDCWPGNLRTKVSAGLDSIGRVSVQ